MFPIIDAHQHCWIYNPERDRWITNNMGILQKDFLPDSLAPLLDQNGVQGTVLVQSEASISGNDYLLELAASCPFIRGVVAWIDPRAPELERQLIRYRQYPEIKGFRYGLQDEIQRDLVLSKSFQRGIELIGHFGFPFDLLIRPDQLLFTGQLVKKFPELLFVIDHMAKPLIRTKKIKEWKSALSGFSSCENVYCKVSGLFTEADWLQWTDSDIQPYIEVAEEVFGMKRLMFASDWPVCLLASDYGEGINFALNYFKSFTLTEQEDFFGKNATRFYQLT